MQVLDNGFRSYLEDPTRFFDFERRASEGADFVLCPGLFDFHLLPDRPTKKVVYLEFEEPNRFCIFDSQVHHIQYENGFYKIFTICPYTAEWLNYQYGNAKRTFVFFPFNVRHLPPRQTYAYDIIYSGHLVNPAIFRYIEAMQQFQYCFVSNHEFLTPAQLPLVTDLNVTYARKLELIARSRITLVHNLLYMNDQLLNTAMTIPGIRFNQAFSQAEKSRGPDGECLAPQLKSRMFEAAFCRSLILCRRDPWNVAERFFEPGLEFVYFEDGRLAETVREILIHFDDYLPVIDRAFERAMNNYTTDHFFDRYLKPLR